MRRPRPLAVLALGALAGSVAVVAAWLVDARAHADGVLANVSVAGSRARGLSRAEVTALAQEISGRFANATVEVHTPAGPFRATVPELGMTVNVERTVEEVLAQGREGAAPRRLWTWAVSLLRPIRLEVAVVVDRAALEAVVVERDPSRTPPTEPFFVLDDGRLAGAEGNPGRGANPAAVARGVRRADPSAGTIVVEVDDDEVPPRFTREDADDLAAKAERIGDGGLVLSAGGTIASVPAPMFRLWAHPVPSGAGLRLGIKADADVVGDVEKLLPATGSPATDAGFTVSGTEVQVVPAKPGTTCCGPATPTAIDAAISGVLARGEPPGTIGPVELPLRALAPRRDEEAARKLGVVEVVGSFTTNHAGGQPRVQNIRRMADIVRGTVVEPGGSFSLNGTVGRRTSENGFLDAPIIGGDGRFQSDVGGGVSQFSTTIFNAAFFGGFDILEYYMHGLYISRYPYGREATLSFPGPDLRFRNGTPYGVLVWTSYTETSITVTLYSTKFAIGEQTGQTVEPRPTTFVPDELKARHEAEPFICTAVRTERTRRYLADERTAIDYFRALYAPEEGVLCD